MDKAKEGLMRGREARLRLKEKNKKEQEDHDRKIELLILNASKESALAAVNLNQLLKKKWAEEKNSWRLLSHLKDAKS